MRVTVAAVVDQIADGLRFRGVERLLETFSVAAGG
jgi:hypothetical protein